MASQIAVQSVQIPPWGIHVVRSPRAVQLKELDRQLGGMGRLNSGLAPGGEELLYASVPEALDHAYSVARHYSDVNEPRKDRGRRKIRTSALP